jgi:hypothetical protein
MLPLKANALTVLLTPGFHAVHFPVLARNSAKYVRDESPMVVKLPAA